MYMDDIKIFAKNEKELEILIQIIRIFSQDKSIECSIKKCSMLKKRQIETSERIELLIQESMRTLGKKL